MKKRAAIALLAGAAVFGSVSAFAATLGLSSNNLGANSEDVVACDADGVNVAYTTAWSDTTNEFAVASVTVEGIDGCDGQLVQVQLVDESGAGLGGSTAAKAVDGATDASVTFTVLETDTELLANISAQEVEDVHVVIAGD
jgi:hypothetical protein